MDKKNLRSRKIHAISYMVITMVFLVLTVFLSNLKNHSDRPKGLPFSDGFISDTGEECRIDNILSGESDDEVVLEKRLPDNLSNDDCLCLESRNANFKVLIDGRERYSFIFQEDFVGLGYGTAFHEINLSKTDNGKVVTIRFEGVYENYKEAKIRNVVIMSATDYISMNVSKRIFSTIVSLLIVFLGIILLLVYWWIPQKQYLPFDVISLGIAALSIGLWLLTDTNIIQLLTGHLYIWRWINRIIVFFAGYPLVSFCNSLTKNKKTIFPVIAFWVNVSAILLLPAVRLLTGKEMLLYFDDVIFGATLMLLLILIVLCIDNAVYCKVNKIKLKLKNLYVVFVIYFCCVTIDVIDYMSLNNTGSYGTFTRIGALVILILLLLWFIKWWIGNQVSVERDRFINKILEYSVSSESPETSVKSILEYMGKEFKLRRVMVFEQQNDGNFNGTYEWFDEGCQPMVESIDFPYKGFGDKLYKKFKDNNNRLVINDFDKYKTINPVFYDLLNKGNVESLVIGPLDEGGELIGLFVLIDVPKDKIEEASEITGVISYFLSQLFLRRDEQKRLKYYSYNDPVSGALNRRAYFDYIESGIDLTSSFGYIQVEISENRKVFDLRGIASGDDMTIDIVRYMTEVFGEENVYRISTTEVAAFGFETEEELFDEDVRRVKEHADKNSIKILVGAVYSEFGTMDLKKIIARAHELLLKSKP